MENIHKLMELSLSIFVFCLGIVILFMDNRILNRILLSTKSYVTENRVIYNQYDFEEVIGLVSKEVMIGMLMTGIEYDIEIDGVIIQKEDYRSDQVDFTLVNSNQYRKEVIFDELGNVIKIRYISEE